MPGGAGGEGRGRGSKHAFGPHTFALTLVVESVLEDENSPIRRDCFGVASWNRMPGRAEGKGGGGSKRLAPLIYVCIDISRGVRVSTRIV